MLRTFGYLFGSSPSPTTLPWITAVLGAVVLAVVIGGQSAAEIVTLDATADASIYPGRADWNYGGKDYSVVGSGRWRTVMKFDLSGVALADSDGSLVLKFQTATEFGGYDIAVSEMPLNNTDWVEGSGSGGVAEGVTWNNKHDKTTLPVAWVGGSHDDSVTYLASSIFANGDATMTITIGQAKLNEWITRGGEVSLLLTSPMAEAGTGTHLHRLYTKEYGTPAQLTFATVPEPSSLLMVVVGLMGLAIFARRGGKK